jgi:calcineurin-like phosphoesterase family protein
MLFIGDVHGKTDKYLDIVNNTDQFSIQLGDFAFNYDCFAALKEPNKHFMIHGNHDNIDILNLDPPSNFLGKFGTVKIEGYDITFCSGAFSIDKVWRIQNFYMTGQKSFWDGEELSWKEGVDFLTHFAKIKPEIVATHSCPQEVSKLIGNPETLRAFGHDPETFKTSTQSLLQQAFELHRPALWVHGHMHIDYRMTIKGTEFVGLGELSTYVID